MGYNHYQYARKVGVNIEMAFPGVTYPKIALAPASVDVWLPAPGTYRLMANGVQFMDFHRDGTDDVIRGFIANNDLYLRTDGTGVVKFGTYAALGAETLQGFVPIKDAAGNSRKLAVIA